MVKVAAVDYDGTLVDSFSGHPALVALKFFFFRAMRPFYLLGEIVEILVRPPYALHGGAEEFLRALERRGLMLGVVTDRSLFSFVISSRRIGLALSRFSFIHAHRSVFDRFVRRFVPSTTRVITTPYYKGDPRALYGLERFLEESAVMRCEACVIGDDPRDRLAAAHSGFRFLLVERTHPDFRGTLNMLDRLP